MEAASGWMSLRGAVAHATIEFVIGARDNALGLYISVPFCRSKCTYCNFASGVYPAGEHRRYVDRLIEDLRQAKDRAAAWAARAGPGHMSLELPRRVDTVYLGGGTPNLLAPELIVRLFVVLRAEFDLNPDAEITMECAPGQFASGALEAMAAAGVNRVSLGVQSFVDAEAHASGRLHTRAIVEKDLRDLRAAGIANLNVDLIAGLPGQTPESWDESLRALIGSGAPHASVYMLEVDEDSRLGRELLAGGARYHAQAVPTDDAIARMYERAIEHLAAAGIEQYEISNFSRPGFASRHNLRYWQRRPYLGIGLDAASMLRANAVPRSKDRSAMRPVLRTKTTDDLKAYLAGAEPAETSWLSVEQQHEEAWFLGLRLSAGVDIATLEAEFGRARVQPAVAVAGRLSADGLLAMDRKTVRLTPQGRLLSNEVFQEFIGIGELPTSRVTHTVAAAI
jgi:oxygen-independent coproporphyrinogen III oxidase